MKNLINTRLTQTLRGIALAACLVGFVPAQGQIFSAERDERSFIYKAFSSTGQPQISVMNFEDNGTATAQMYDENFNLIKEFNLLPSTDITRIVTEERLPISGEFVDVEIDRYRYDAQNLEDVISEAQRNGLTSHTQEGNVHTFLPEQLPESEDFYRKIVYTEGDDFFTLYRIHHSQQYGEWQATGERTETSLSGLSLGCDFYNLDSESPSGWVFMDFSQTLFNDDDKYEYLVGQYELNTESGYMENPSQNAPCGQV